MIPATDVPPGPSATASCRAPSVAATVTCTLTSVPEFDFVWRASTDTVFASGIVTTDATAMAQFTFSVPASPVGQGVLVVIVDWTAATSIGVAGGPVPTTVPAGHGDCGPIGAFVLLRLAATALPVGSAGTALRSVRTPVRACAADAWGWKCGPHVTLATASCRCTCPPGNAHRPSGGAVRAGSEPSATQDTLAMTANGSDGAMTRGGPSACAPVRPIRGGDLRLRRGLSGS